MLKILLNKLRKTSHIDNKKKGALSIPFVIVCLIMVVLFTTVLTEFQHRLIIRNIEATADLAAVEALRNGDDDIKVMRESYDQRRRYLMNAFREMGLSCFEPYGAFYTFPCIKEFGMTSDEFATRFLEEEKVAVVPGTAFGACGEGFLRISYAYSLEQLKEALGRLSHFVARLRAEKGAR